jgi:hypothetical protein
MMVAVGVVMASTTTTVAVVGTMGVMMMTTLEARVT